MSVIKTVKSASLFPFVIELLEQGHYVKMPVSGNSMYPLLRDGKDSVEFVPCNFETISKGDIVLVQRKDGRFVMHRVC